MEKTAKAPRKGKYALASPVDGGSQWWNINDMERMYAVVSIAASFPQAENIIRDLWDLIPESAALHESVAQSQAEMIHEEMRRVPKRVCPLCRGKGCDYCARTGSYTDENDAQAQPEPERGTLDVERAEDWLDKHQIYGGEFSVRQLAELLHDYSLSCLAPSPLPVREQSVWISVKDRLPEHGQYVLTVGGEILRIAHPARVICDKEGKIEFWWALKQRNPTHWMPMIEPPAIAGEKEE